VATVVYSARALPHLERACEFLASASTDTGLVAASAIRSAVENLAVHPLIGRRVHADLRELVISYGQTGYIALYRFVVPRDEVRVLTIRRQREIGFVP
jgi:plasmid stabilization system protein ParE